MSARCPRRAPAIVASLLVACAATAPAAAQSFWLTPSPGSLDYLDLASREWLVRLAEDVGVIQFYMQNLMSRRLDIVGPNTVQAFVARGTFHHLRRLGFRVAMEAGVVKPYWCGDFDAREAIAASADAIRNVQQADGRVDYVSMDEPFINGIDACTMLDWQVANQTAWYIKGLRRIFPRLRIGMTEAYPRFDVERLAAFEALLRHRNAPLDFYHLDLHLSAALRTKSMADIERDVRLLCDHLQSKGIAFGLIIWGDDGRSDFLYTEAAMKLVRLNRTLFQMARRPPAHIPLQSWTRTPEGLAIVPRNLTPDEDATHLNLLRRTRRCVLTGTACDDTGGLR